VPITPLVTAIMAEPGLVHDAINSEPVTAPRPSADIAIPRSALAPLSKRVVKSGTRTWKL